MNLIDKVIVVAIFVATMAGEESSFWDSEIQDDFKNFINSELEKAQKL